MIAQVGVVRLAVEITTVARGQIEWAREGFPGLAVARPIAIQAIRMFFFAWRQRQPLDGIRVPISSRIPKDALSRLILTEKVPRWRRTPR
jgi:hypothetical protein